MALFQDSYASYYDNIYSEKKYDKECDLIIEAVRRYGEGLPNAIIDIGCGTGKHSMEFAKRGFSVTGVDNSSAMIDLAAKKIACNEGKKLPKFILGDVRYFRADAVFDLAIMMFAVAGYLTTNEDVLLGLRNIRKHLKTGALFICDFWYGPTVVSQGPTDRFRVIESAGITLIRGVSTKIKPSIHTADVNIKMYSIKENNLVRSASEQHTIRYFYPQEYSLFLSQAGFEMISITAFPSLDAELDEHTWNALVVAKAR